MFPPLSKIKVTKKSALLFSCSLLLFSRFNQLKATGLTVCMPDSLLGFVDSCGSSESLWDLGITLNLHHPVSQL